MFSKERNAALTCLGLRFFYQTDHVAYVLKVRDDNRLAEGAGGSLILARLLHRDILVCGPVHYQQRCRQPGQYVKRLRRMGIDVRRMRWSIYDHGLHTSTRGRGPQGGIPAARYAEESNTVSPRARQGPGQRD